jgi:hypothetical protein
MTQFISHPALRDENLKGSTVSARAYLMGANLIDAGGFQGAFLISSALLVVADLRTISFFCDKGPFNKSCHFISCQENADGCV